jgi:hypothetical protein
MLSPQKYRFYKNEDGWFIDIPGVLEEHIFEKGNLQMVCGADLLLDHLCYGKSEIILEVYDDPFDGAEHKLEINNFGMDTKLLEEYDHPIEVGAYYNRESDGFVVWLCPVTMYVFEGKYPDNIYFRVV